MVPNFKTAELNEYQGKVLCWPAVLDDDWPKRTKVGEEERKQRNTRNKKNKSKAPPTNMSLEEARQNILEMEMISNSCFHC